MRFVALFIALGVTAVISGISLYLTPNNHKACTEPQPIGKCARADAIVAVSGGDTTARADEAIKLFQQGWAPLLIFSGAAADETGPSNAQAMANHAIEVGVPESNIIIEEFSRTTAENARNTSRFIAERSIERIILVTSAYHQRRASLEFTAILGPSVSIVNHPVATDKHWVGFWWWTTTRGWWLAGGELLKIVAFYSGQGVDRL